MASENWARTHVGGTWKDTPDRSERDLYITPTVAVEELCALEKFSDNVWECCCGTGAISSVLESKGYDVRTSDIHPLIDGAETLDFMEAENDSWDGDIITNPPFNNSLAMLKKALDVVKTGHKVVMFLPISFLETAKRVAFLKEHPMCRVYVARLRLRCLRPDEEETTKSSAVCYCWMVWEKGWHGEPIIRWFH